MYGDDTPGELIEISWIGGGVAACTEPMLEMSYELIVTGPGGIDHTIAEGSCAECTELVAVDTGYTCVQSASSNCSGTWYIRKQSTFLAPPTSSWTTVSAGCTAAGSELNCLRSATAGTAALFNGAPLVACDLSSGVSDGTCVTLPDGVAMPELDVLAIEKIRATHFSGGVDQDNTKGLFYSSTTDSQLERIFELGMRDPSDFVFNESTGKYVKSFPLTGVGFRSIKYGDGLPSSSVSLVISKYGQVASMYPE